MLIPATLSLTNDARLRPPTPEDGPALQRLIDANREHLAPWMAWAHRGYDSTWLTASLAAMEAGTTAQFVFEREGELLGTIGFHGFDPVNRATSIGYWIAASAQGHGYVTTAVRSLSELAFQAWGMHRIQLRAAVENRRSRAVAERCGFVEEGIAREAELVDGRFLDLVVYSLLAP